MVDLIGQKFGNYRLLRLLGQGGFAAVYLAEQLHLGTQVAIKILASRLTSDSINSFLSEARIVASLAHSHIVRVLDFGVEGNVPYLAMDYAPDGTLRQRHPKGTYLPLADIIPYVLQISQALQYAHQRKLIHRDVKPENMLVGRNSNILLADFGIAVTAQSTNSQGMRGMAGTIYYMAPEQLRGKPHLASDQYALGIVVYEWLCGEYPFSGSFTEIAAQHILTSPPPLHSKIPAISLDIDRVVLKALAKDPLQRFENIQAFAHALEQASRSEISSFTEAMDATLQSGNFYPEQVPIHLAPPLQTPLKSPSVLSPPLAASNTSMDLQMLIPPNPRISRRVIMSGIAGLATLGIATSSIAWAIYAQGRQPSATFKQGHSPAVRSTTTMVNTPSDGTILTYRHHTNQVTAVAWSSDGKYIASGGADNTAQVWNATTGAPLYLYKGHYSFVTSVAWSPNSQRIASASYDQTVQVWNATDGGNVYIYRGHTDYVNALAWSRDGTHIASAAGALSTNLDNSVQVWNSTNGARVSIYRRLAGGIFALAWSPDGKRIVFGGYDMQVDVLNASDARILLTSSGHSLEVNGVAWSPDGTLFASASWDKTVRLWNASTGELVYTYQGHTGYVNTVAWSPDGKWIASGGAAYGDGGGMVQVWNPSSGAAIFTYRGKNSFVSSITWSPDSTHLAAACLDAMVRIWKVL